MKLTYTAHVHFACFQVLRLQKSSAPQITLLALVPTSAFTYPSCVMASWIALMALMKECIAGVSPFPTITSHFAQYWKVKKNLHACSSMNLSDMQNTFQFNTHLIFLFKTTIEKNLHFEAGLFSNYIFQIEEYFWTKDK